MQSQVAGLSLSLVLAQLQNTAKQFRKVRNQQINRCKLSTTQIQKLAKAKYQDNLEFIQWLKWYLSDKISMNYDAEASRHHATVHMLFTERKTNKWKSNKENLGEDRQLMRTQRSMHNLNINEKNGGNLLKKTGSFCHLGEI